MSENSYRLRVKSKSDTCGNWALHPNFVPLQGEICVYTDAIRKEITDGQNTVYVYEPRVKIGDGQTPISDLRFVSQDILDQLTEHMNNTDIHITQIERLKWNSKVDSEFDGTQLKLYNEYSS